MVTLNHDRKKNDLPNDVNQLQNYFSKENSYSKVRAFPCEGLDITLWILGSNTDSAYLAAQMGLPYAFTAHFVPHNSCWRWIFILKFLDHPNS